jgi:ActR/RegA family two-component response regulator
VAAHRRVAPLPGILHEIADVAGEESAIAVAKIKGGTNAYIPLPENIDASHWLVAAVGEDAARSIARCLGGAAFLIPLAGTGTRGRQREAIRQALTEGKSVTEAARIAGVHVQTVKRFKARQHAPE